MFFQVMGDVRVELKKAEYPRADARESWRWEMIPGGVLDHKDPTVQILKISVLGKYIWRLMLKLKLPGTKHLTKSDHQATDR